MYSKYIFGTPVNYIKSKIVILPIPFDGTSSYRKYSQNAPYKILEASNQVDLFDIDFGNLYRRNVYMEKISPLIIKINNYILSIQKKFFTSFDSAEKINSIMSANNNFIYKWTLNALNADKIPILLGGEHSIIFGAIQACFNVYKSRELSILHFDAHSDMRLNYDGFNYSHASIINNIQNRISTPKRIIQVGIRDVSYSEYKQIQLSNEIYSFLDKDIRKYKLLGSFDVLSEDIIEKLGDLIYITIDIDGLDIPYCSNTGTPVPGGLNFDHIIHILSNIKKKKKRIIGADICETSSSTLDSIVSMRLLYKLTGVLSF